MRRYCTVAVVLGVALALPNAANAAIFTVDRDSDDPAAGDCSVPGGPCTLRAAVTRANGTEGADEIVLGARTVALTHSDGALDVTDELTIRGAGTALSVIDGNGLEDEIIDVDDEAGRMTLEGVRLTNGESGAVAMEALSLIVRNAQVDHSSSGDAIEFDPEGDDEDTATLLIADSVVSDNEAAGLEIATDGIRTIDAQVVRSVFERNGGGAIEFYPSAIQDTSAAAAAEPGVATLLVSDTTFDSNVASQGGAIDIDPSFGVDANVVVSRSTFSGNRAVSEGEGSARGGAINIWRGRLRAENSTFSGNVAEGRTFDSGGGAIAVSGSALATLTHVTIADNIAGGRARGGGIAGPRFVELQRGARSFVPTTVTNSIVTGNTSEIEEGGVGALATRADDCDGPVGTGGGNLESGETCGFRDASDKQNADPKLAALAANGGPTKTRAHAADSPAVNAAVASACLATDQRGVARSAAACDSGAFEFAPGAPAAAVQPPTGGVLGTEASSESCISVRRFKIRLRIPRGESVKRAVVLVNGEPVPVKRGKRLTAVVDLRGLKKSRYRVKITLHLKGGGKVSGVRRYWTCTPAIRWTKPPKV